ncbi:MAG: hypothetical protein AB9828_00885 [Sphaerochaetaceae bacterium]
MLKRIIFAFLLCCVLTGPLLAFDLVSLTKDTRTAPSYGLLDNFIQITTVPNQPLYREALADPYAMSSSFSMVTMQDEASIPTYILVAEENESEYQKKNFRTVNANDNSYLRMKTAINLGLMRVSFMHLGPLPSIQVELALQGGMATVFNNFGASDTPGFDGMYFVGANARIGKVLAVRFGFHHFSGHYGDEILDRLWSYTDEDNPNPLLPNDIKRLVEYTRDNSWLGGVSIEPTSWFRLYFEAELPQKGAWIRPAIHVPESTVNPDDETQNQRDYIADQEGIRDVIDTVSESYKAWRLQGGMELRLPIPTLGSLFVAADVQFHQDGQTKHQIGAYSEDNPWENEYTVGGGLELNQQFLGRNLRLEAYYHSGRFPLLNFFYQRSNYVTIGIGING